MAGPIRYKDPSDLTGEIISAALTVHRILGPGFLESVYEEAICIELEHRDIHFERQKTIPVSYGGKKVGEHRLDLLVEGAVVVELKASSGLDKIHFATVRSYMKAAGVETGLIINFAAVFLSIKRVFREKAP